MGHQHKPDFLIANLFQSGAKLSFLNTIIIIHWATPLLVLVRRFWPKDIKFHLTS